MTSASPAATPDAADRGAALRAARERAGLTQREAAALCHLNRRSLQRIERGDLIPRLGLTTYLLLSYEDAAARRATWQPRGGR